MSPADSSSYQSDTTITSAEILQGTLQPNPITLRGQGFGLGLFKIKLSYFLTHLVKLVTGSNLTLSNPTYSACAFKSLIANSKTYPPHILGPNLSLNRANRSYA